MKALLAVFIVVAGLLAPGLAGAADYQDLLEKGEFFLAKGVSYTPDAVRVLEEAASVDGARAAGDPRLISALGKAYLGVGRYTEAYLWIERFLSGGLRGSKVEGLKDHLLNEAGVGRFRVFSALPAEGVTASFRAAADQRMDATAKKVLDKLNIFLAKPFDLTREGLTILVPEGRLVFECSMPLSAQGGYVKEIEIYAGDELEQFVVSSYPPSSLWKVRPGNRNVALTWPAVEKARSYRLTRSGEGEAQQVVYEGEGNSFTDVQAPPGQRVRYLLEVIGSDGLLWGLSSVLATALPPVSSIQARAHLNGELAVVFDWEVGPGSLDRLVIRKTERGEEKPVLDQRGEEILRSGQIVDGPVSVLAAPQVVGYEVEGLVEGDPVTAKSRVEVTIPAEVARIDAVREQVSSERVVVEWDTFPRDAVAEGYYIYLQREPTAVAELVGTVRDSGAREYSYIPKSVESLAKVRHIVVPFVGGRFLVEPIPVEAKDKPPEIDMSRVLRRSRKLPSAVLSWAPYRAAVRYIVRVEGRKEFIVRENYVELTGLQPNIGEPVGEVRVFAVKSDGNQVPLLRMNVQYEKYLSDELPEEQR